MYADRVEAEPKKSALERLHGNTAAGLLHRRTLAGKRQRQDNDKWKHDLFEGDGLHVPRHKVDGRDLRSKLQKKGTRHSHQSGKGSLLAVKDLRDKLSGTKHLAQASKPSKKTVTVEVLPVETQEVDPPKKKKKPELVDGFLRSLGLGKYSITFKAEEVDMAALLHMGDGDLKALGIPMGPRKKILTALDSRARHV